jgi:hypothetical protein
VAEVIISLALNESDSSWVEKQALMLLKHPHPNVRGAAATSLGHLARLHRDLNLKNVLPVLRALQEDPVVAGRAGDAIDDIEMFMRD